MPSNETYIQRLLSQSSKSRNLKRPHREESSDDDNYEAAYKEVTSGFRKSSSRAGSSKGSKKGKEPASRSVSSLSKKARTYSLSPACSPRSSPPLSPGVRKTVASSSRSNTFKVLSVSCLFRSLKDDLELQNARIPDKAEVTRDLVPLGLSTQDAHRGIAIGLNWSPAECDQFVRKILPYPFAYIESLKTTGCDILTVPSSSSPKTEGCGSSIEPKIFHELVWLPCMRGKVKARGKKEVTGLRPLLENPTGFWLHHCKGNATSGWRSSQLFIVFRVMHPDEVDLNHYRQWFKEYSKSGGSNPSKSQQFGDFWEEDEAAGGESDADMRSGDFPSPEQLIRPAAGSHTRTRIQRKADSPMLLSEIELDGSESGDEANELAGGAGQAIIISSDEESQAKLSGEGSELDVSPQTPLSHDSIPSNCVVPTTPRSHAPQPRHFKSPNLGHFQNPWLNSHK